MPVVNTTPLEIPEAKLDVNVTNVTIITTPELPKNLSITEEYEKIFWKKANKSYYYVSEDPYYGRVFVWGHNDIAKLTSPQFLFLVDNTTYTLNTSKAESDADQEIVADDVHRRKLNYANYAWWNTTSGELGACYVWITGSAGTYYLKQNCMEDNTTKSDGSPTGAQVIWENLTFAHKPVLAHDWLRKYAGQEPMKIQRGYTYIDEDWDTQFMVDHVYFDNHNGTITKLYIHQGLRIPVRVDLLQDNKVIWHQTYRGFSINDASLNSYFKIFTDEI
jgi:hypothetical protein